MANWLKPSVRHYINQSLSGVIIDRLFGNFDSTKGEKR
jgi:hypothetical protein